MKIETIQFYADPKNQILSKDHYEMIGELIGSCQEHGLNLFNEIVDEDEDVIQLLERASGQTKDEKIKSILDEVFVRAIFDGGAEECFFEL